MPHAWLERRGERIATHHLQRPGTFLLLAGSGGEPWCEAAVGADVPIDAYRVGAGCDLQDQDGAWSTLRGHGEGGVVLVRPDGHVSFRAASLAGNPAGELQHALEVALGQRARGTAGLKTGGRA
jgi:2,4-dichlorophenol 6-monooxygenase